MDATKKDDKLLMKEWTVKRALFLIDLEYIQQVLQCEKVIMLHTRKDDNALIPVMKIRRKKWDILPDLSFIEKKKNMVEQMGQKFPISEQIIELPKITSKISIFSSPDKVFLEAYKEIEKRHEIGIVPLVYGTQDGLFPSYDVVPRPAQKPVPPKA